MPLIKFDSTCEEFINMSICVAPFRWCGRSTTSASDFFTYSRPTRRTFPGKIAPKHHKMAILSACPNIFEEWRLRLESRARLLKYRFTRNDRRFFSLVMTIKVAVHSHIFESCLVTLGLHYNFIWKAVIRLYRSFRVAFSVFAPWNTIMLLNASRCIMWTVCV